MWFAKPVALAAGLSASEVVITQQDAPKRLKLSDCVHLQHLPAADAVPTEASWRPVVEKLAEALSAMPAKDKRIHIRLSNRWARWQLLPAQEHLSSDDDLTAYAALHFQNVYGAAAQDWRITHSPLFPGRPTPACAIDTALLHALKEACAASGTELESVQPYLSSVFDYWRNEIREKAYWLAVVEPAYVCMVYVQNQSWQAVRTQRQNISSAAQLTAMAAQISVAAGLPQTRVPLLIAGTALVELTSADSQVRRLSLVGTVLLEHPQYCLAVGL